MTVHAFDPFTPGGEPQCSICGTSEFELKADLPNVNAASPSMKINATFSCGAVWRSPAGLAKKNEGQIAPHFTVLLHGSQNWLEITPCLGG